MGRCKMTIPLILRDISELTNMVMKCVKKKYAAPTAYKNFLI